MYEAIASLFNVETAVMLFTGLAAFATVLTLALPMLERDKLGTRMKYVALERDELRARRRAELNQSSRGRLRQDPKGLMKQVVDQLNLRQMMENENIKIKLRQAGLRGQGPIYTFMFFRFAMPFILFFAALVYLNLIATFGLPPMVRLTLCFVAAFLGYYAPNVFVQNLITRRQESIKKVFPNALDLLLICVESGMSIEAAFNKVAQEIAADSVEMAEELGLTTAELSYLQNRRQAFENLAVRTGLQSVKSVTTALVQAERYGTPLGKALRVLAKEQRDMRMAEAEKRAAALPPKLTVPMIAFFLPVLFAVIMGPAIIMATRATGGG